VIFPLSQREGVPANTKFGVNKNRTHFGGNPTEVPPDGLTHVQLSVKKGLLKGFPHGLKNGVNNREAG